jgi:hypothetical protein
MVLRNKIIEILHLSDSKVHARLLVVALDGRIVGRTPVDRDLLGSTMAADRFRQKAFGRPLVAVLGQQASDLLPRLIYGPIQVILTFRTLFRISEAILEEPPAEKGGGDIQPM